jgi:hypothetical protein
LPRCRSAHRQASSRSCTAAGSRFAAACPLAVGVLPVGALAAGALAAGALAAGALAAGALSAGARPADLAEDAVRALAAADGAVAGRVRIVIAIASVTAEMAALTMVRNREWLRRAQRWLSSLTHAFLTQLCPDGTQAPDGRVLSVSSPMIKPVDEDLLPFHYLSEPRA